MQNLSKNNWFIGSLVHWFIGSLLIANCYSQSFNVDKAYNIWYFGEYAGLDFNSGAPKVLKDGKLKNLEGCAAISDKDGKLLFYTNGMTVWNRVHDTLKNGKGLKGNNSATQSAIIVPQPGNKNLYYIFTVASQADPKTPGLADGVKYNIVDISLDDGLGEVTQKNTDLVAPTTEKVTAVRHKNNKDIWVITHLMNNNIFYSYLISSSGLNTTPVISKVGPVHSGDNYSESALGYMKASFDGKHLALAYWGNKPQNYNDGNFQLYDFDNGTGMISNPVLLPNYPTAYGVEFSPDCKRLYGTTNIFPSEAGLLYQWNLEAGSAAAIKSSEVKLGTWTNCALQLGPDGKIYGARKADYDYEYLSVINYPDSLGTKCGFVKEGLYLEGKHSLAGLPNFIQSYVNSSDFVYENTCLGDSTKFFLNDKSGIDSVLWSFGDAASGSKNTSGAFDACHIFSKAGTYTVNLTKYQNGKASGLKKVIQINPLPEINLGKDTAVCVNDEIIIDAGIGFEQYKWSFNNELLPANNWQITAKQSGAYSVTVTDKNGCINNTLRNIYFSLLPPDVNLGKDTAYCRGGDNVVLLAGSNYSEIKWYFNNEELNADKEELAVEKTGIYWIKLTNICGSVYDSVKIDIMDCELLIPDVLTINGDNSNDVFEIKNIEKYPDSHLTVFNRWGKIIFESFNYENISNWWNGNKCSAGTYFYILVNDKMKLNLKGAVTVIK